MKKKYLRWTAFGVAAYVLLVLLLVLAEGRAENATIHSFGEALWYTLVTFTTVGYGDYAPVTAGGRLISVVFLLLSVGFLAFLVSLAMNLFWGRLYPKLRLALHTGSHWYIFSRMSEDAKLLARAICREDPKSVCVFCNTEPAANRDFLCLSGGPETAVQMHRERGKNTVFFLDEGTCKQAEAFPTSTRVVIQTRTHPEHISEQVTFYDPCESAARLYWQQHPVDQNHCTVLLIGSGEYAGYLLERGLLFNVFSPSQRIEYHTFGNWDHFRRNYHQLGNAVSIDAAGEGDSVFFHRTAWNEDADLLERADRIIICEDDDETNKQVFRSLRRYFAVSGDIHLRLTEWDDDGMAFGIREQMMTPELLIHERLTFTARQMNELYRKSVGADKSAAWGELSEFHRQSNIAAADHLLMKLKILFPKEDFSEVYPALCLRAYQRVEELRAERLDELRAIEHTRWMRFCILHNWKYGPVRDDAHRIHPLLRPYESLSEEDRAKNDFAWDLFRDLSTREKESEGA